MARAAIIFGLLLCGLTAAALVTTTMKSPSQFIPMVIGIPALFCGVVALNPHRRKHAMRAAAILALAGTLVGGIRSLALLTGSVRHEEFDRYLGLLNAALFVFSAMFLCFWIIDFFRQRHRRHQLRSRSIPLQQRQRQNREEARESA